MNNVSTSYQYNWDTGQKAEVVTPRKQEESCCIARTVEKVSASLRRSAQYGTLSHAVPVAISCAEGLVSSVEYANHMMQRMPTNPSNTKDSSSGISLNTSQVKILGELRFGASVIAGIAAIVNIIGEGENISLEIKRGRTEEVITSAATMTYHIGLLGDAVASTANGLAMSGVIHAVTWASPLAIASACASSIIIVVNLRAMKRSNELLTLLEGGYSLQGKDMFRALEDELTDSKKKDGHYFLKKHFGIINYEKYSAQVLHVIRSGTANSKVALIESFKDRLRDKIACHKLAILSAIVGFIGIAILFFPVLGPALLAIGLLTCAALISFIRYIDEMKSIHTLQDRIDKICHFDAIPDNKIPHFARELKG